MKPKTCPKCNKVFIPNKRKQKYCSHKCSVKKGWNYFGGYVYEVQKIPNYAKECL